MENIYRKYLSKMVINLSIIKHVALTIILSSTALGCYAIDNPESPDYVADFNQREKLHLDAIDQAKTTQDSLAAYAAYEKYLDNELNQAYKSLLPKLEADQLNKLKLSQRNWIKFKDSEFEFIASNWTSKNFGSSSVISRGAYRTTIYRNRVIILLNYLKNY